MPTIRLVVLLTLVLAARSAMAETNKSPIVIIHGAWGGAHHWKAVADALTREHERTVRRASLTGLGERAHLANRQIDLDTHIQDVLNVISYDDLDRVILIAHSYGGAVALGVADKIPERLSQVIYLDAHLLEHGESYLTRHGEERERITKRAEEDGEGWLVPVDWPNPMRDTPHPLSTLLQPMTLTSPARLKVPSSFWLFADAQPPEQDSRYFYYERAKSYGWSVRVLSWDHNPQRSRPAELAAELAAHFHEHQAGAASGASQE